jgi:hypothetical protein
MKSIAIKRKIHSWGGLGSQLYAYSFLREMQIRFPKKTFLIIHHTGGVTRRGLEINSLLKAGEVFEVDDYSTPVNNEMHSVGNGPPYNGKSSSLGLRFMKLLKVFIKNLGLVVFDPTPNIICSLRHLPFSFRGHYSDLEVSSESLACIWDFISENSREVVPGDSLISLHYRRGDLTESIGKIPIDASRIGEVLNIVGNKYVDLGVRVYSDSGSEAVQLAKEFSGLTREFEAVNTDIFTTMFGLITSFAFIGTPSKISFWVAMIRIELFPELVTYMPREAIANLESNYRVPDLKNRLVLY